MPLDLLSKYLLLLSTSISDTWFWWYDVLIILFSSLLSIFWIIFLSSFFSISSFALRYDINDDFIWEEKMNLLHTYEGNFLKGFVG